MCVLPPLQSALPKREMLTSVGEMSLSGLESALGLFDCLSGVRPTEPRLTGNISIYVVTCCSDSRHVCFVGGRHQFAAISRVRDRRSVHERVPRPHFSTAGGQNLNHSALVYFAMNHEAAEHSKAVVQPRAYLTAAPEGNIFWPVHMGCSQCSLHLLAQRNRHAFTGRLKISVGPEVQPWPSVLRMGRRSARHYRGAGRGQRSRCPGSPATSAIRPSLHASALASRASSAAVAA